MYLETLGEVVERRRVLGVGGAAQQVDGAADVLGDALAVHVAEGEVCSRLRRRRQHLAKVLDRRGAVARTAPALEAADGDGKAVVERSGAHEHLLLRPPGPGKLGERKEECAFVRHRSSCSAPHRRPRK